MRGGGGGGSSVAAAAIVAVGAATLLEAMVTAVALASMAVGLMDSQKELHAAIRALSRRPNLRMVHTKRKKVTSKSTHGPLRDGLLFDG